MDESKRRDEIRRLRRLLRGVGELSEHASLSGALSTGAPEAVRHFNRALSRLHDLGVDTGGLFDALPEDAGFDRLGVCARLLSDYLRDDERERAGAAPSVVIGNLAGLEELEQLGEIGKEVRVRIADAFRAGQPGHAGHPEPDSGR